MFLQAGFAVFVVNALVVITFALLGNQDALGLLQLLGHVGRRRRRRGDRDRGQLRGDRVRVRDPDLVPAARAREPVPAAPPPAAGRDAGHVPPLADGRQPRRARRRGDRRRPAARARGGLLPRHRQALQPGRVHREPGGRRQPARRARPGDVRRAAQEPRQRGHRHRLQVGPAEGADRVHPAAPRDGGDVLLLRPGEGAGGRAVRRARRPRTAGRRPTPSTSASSATAAPSRRRARPRSSCSPTRPRPRSGR